MVESLGYEHFFYVTAVMGIPTLLLIGWLRLRRAPSSETPAPGHQNAEQHSRRERKRPAFAGLFRGSHGPQSAIAPCTTLTTRCGRECRYLPAPSASRAFSLNMNITSQ